MIENVGSRIRVKAFYILFVFGLVLSMSAVLPVFMGSAYGVEGGSYTGTGVKQIVDRDGNGSYVVTDAGEVYSWGAGSRGSNGNGSTDNNLIAEKVQGLEGEFVVDVSYRGESDGGYALTRDGHVYSWGYDGNFGGSNGDGGLGDNLVAEPVLTAAGTPLSGIKKIDSDYDGITGYALTEDGKVYSWGSNERGAAGNGETGTLNGGLLTWSVHNDYAGLVVDTDNQPITGIKDIKGRWKGAAAITTDGRVYSWGEGDDGANGDGDFKGTDPVGTGANPAAEFVLDNNMNPITGVETIVTLTDRFGSYALTTDGRVYSWGLGNSGGYGGGINGDGSSENNYTADFVSFDAGQPITGIKEVVNRGSAPGGYALTLDGRVYSWGPGYGSMNGDGSDDDNLYAALVIDEADQPLTNIEKIVAREDGGGYALTTGGNVYAWGHAWGNGSNGNGSTEANAKAGYVIDKNSDPISGIADIAAAASESGYALTDGGQVYSWGSNGYGSGLLGRGTTEDIGLHADFVLDNTSMPITDIVKIVDRSWNGAYALNTTGQIYSWGKGEYGANGDGSVDNNVYADTVQGIVLLSLPELALSVYNIDEDAPVSLTVHKFEQTETLGAETDGTVQDTTGLTPIANAKFRVSEVKRLPSGYELAPLALASDSKAWDAIMPYLAGTETFNPEATNTILEEVAIITTNEAGEALFEGPMGLYWVEEIESGTNNATDLVDPFLISIPQAAPTPGEWIYDVHAYPKAPVTEATMTVNHDNTKGLGSPVVWTVNSEIPYLGQNVLETFRIDNTLPAELSYSSEVLTVLDKDGVAVTDLVLGTDYNIEKSGKNVSAVFTEAGLAKLQNIQGGEVVFVMDTTVDSIGSGFLESNANVTINGSVIPLVEETTWGSVQVKAYVEGDTEKPLGDATFKVYASEADAEADSNGIAINGVTEFTTDPVTGQVMLDGLYAANGGTSYWLVETDAPAGYLNDLTPREIIVTPGADPLIVEFGQVQSSAVILPPLGSTSLVIFMIVGLLSVAGGTRLVFGRRKNDDDEEADELNEKEFENMIVA